MSYIQRLACVRSNLLAFLAWVGLASAGRVGLADTITLADLNSQFVINTTAGGSGGLWSVDSANYADTQALFYQIGASGLPNAWQYSGSSSFTTDGSENNGLVIQYQGNAASGYSGLHLTQIDTLLGSQPGSGSSLVSEELLLSNFGSSPADLHLFQYTNLQLSNGGDTLQFQPPAEMVQTSASATTEFVATGPPTAHEVGLVPTLLDELESGSPVLLSNGNGPLSGNTASGMEWDVPLGVGNSYNIGEQYSLNLVPEPSSGSLLAALALFAALARFGLQGFHGARKAD